MQLIDRFRLRAKRQRFRVRAFRKGRDLRSAVNRTEQIGRDDVLLFCVVRNERIRLPYFLSYYRKLGINHFLFVDNGSDDGSAVYLADQPDVSVWSTNASYRKSRHGVDWLNHLLYRYGTGHWCLTVDCDEFLIYPFCDTRPIQALTGWLDATDVKSFSSMLLDMYPRGRIQDAPYTEGEDPFRIAEWFDPGNYTLKRNPYMGEIWIQGGPRARTFFADDPKSAPALNKIPLVKWQAPYTYVSSTHMLLPRGLNLVYADNGGEKASGCLLHAKFIDTFAARAEEEMARGEHYKRSAQYQAYAEALKDQPQLWCKWSEKYINWRQLEILGLMSKGNWA